MKSIVLIILLVFVVHSWSYSQIRYVSGDLRYEHEYLDLQYNNSLSVINRSSPAMNLNVGGTIFSPRILNFELHTALTLNYGKSSANGISQTNQQSYWNRYDATVDFFAYSPVKLQVAARDHLIENTYDFGGVSRIFGQTRSQEQRARFSMEKNDFFPSVSLYYVQNRSWALTGVPSEQSSRQLSFSVASASGKASTVNLSGSFTRSQERYSGIEDKLATIQFTGSKELSLGHRLDINSEYLRYSTYSTLNGAVRYSGLLNEKLRMSTGISGAQTNSAYSTYQSVDASQAFNMVVSDHYQVGLSVNGGSGKYISLLSQSSSYNPLFGTNASVQHHRVISKITFTNALSAGYLLRRFGELFRTWETSFTNTISADMGAFSVGSDYSYSRQFIRGSQSWSSSSGSAGFIVSGPLSFLRSQSSVHVRTDLYEGDVQSGRNQRNLNFTQILEGQLTYGIPMTLGLGGSTNFYFSTLINNTYGWHFSFSSPSFFIRGLFANYRYTSNFDPYYRREIVDQNGSLTYQWRSLSFSARVRYSTFPNRIRDITFSVSRPF